ncbi:hypothetical protein ACFQBQ_07660 [Granulicella cerasi]|uniref:Uncharacterized protein n=1 Tax=Granulicella cerasi TaxID=741063 RepID=A0ABW1Z988_9BACT|nr:hypothetical protein [Granulicella cerasi]
MKLTNPFPEIGQLYKDAAKRSDDGIHPAFKLLALTVAAPVLAGVLMTRGRENQ